MESRRLDRGIVWGSLLVLIGIVFLVQSLDLIRLPWRVMGGLGMAVAAAVFFGVYAQDRRQWWALFPAFGLAFPAIMTLLGGLPLVDDLAGPLLLGGMGLVFHLVYTSNRTNWWAIIPSGVMYSIAAVAALDNLFPRFDGGWLFFTGLAATFGMVWLETDRAQNWALGVALACGALVALIVLGSLVRLLLPLGLVAAGVYLLVRAQRNS